jgi:uncharacterized damage-inducible protein DinB
MSSAPTPASTPTVTPLADMAQCFGVHGPVLKKLTGAFDEADWLYRPQADRSHAYWILGHITAYRYALAKAVGADLDGQDLMEQFGKGSSPSESITVTVDELFEHFDRAGAAFAEGLTKMTDEALLADCGRTFPQGSNTIGGQIQFMNFHEAYHLGQISMIAYARGKESLV